MYLGRSQKLSRRIAWDGRRKPARGKFMKLTRKNWKISLFYLKLIIPAEMEENHSFAMRPWVNPNIQIDVVVYLQPVQDFLVFSDRRNLVKLHVFLHDQLFQHFNPIILILVVLPKRSDVALDDSDLLIHEKSCGFYDLLLKIFGNHVKL